MKDIVLRTVRILINISVVLLVPTGADSGVALIKPVNAVRKVGDSHVFVCWSPEGYTELKKVTFTLTRNGSQIGEKVPTGSYIERLYADFTIDNLTVKDAGVYMCIVTADDKNVSVSTNLYVYTGKRKTKFAEKGSTLEMKCLDVENHNLTAAVAWFVNGVEVSQDRQQNIYTTQSTLQFKKVGVQDAYSNITCVLTSEENQMEYGSVVNAKENNTAAEFQKPLSVIHHTQCRKVPCRLEVNVSGMTHVDITWSNTNNPLYQNQDNIITSKSGVVNNTGVITLKITGGGDVWMKNITVGTSPDPSTEVPLAEILSVIGVVGVVGLVVVVVWCIMRRKSKKDDSQTTDADRLKSESKVAGGQSDGGQSDGGQSDESERDEDEKDPMTVEQNGGAS